MECMNLNVGDSFVAVSPVFVWVEYPDGKRYRLGWMANADRYTERKARCVLACSWSEADAPDDLLPGEFDAVFAGG